MSRVPRSRLFAVGLAVLGVCSACTPQGPATASPSPTQVDAAAVNDALSAVADARRVAAEQVDAELRAGVRVAPLAAGLRSPSSIDETLEEVPSVAALVGAVDPAQGAPALDRLDAALVAGQDAITGTLAEVEPGSWQERFLGAQRAVLDALATWSAASRDVHAVTLEHWPTWQEVVADAEALDENRWRYRSTEEAAGTWEIELGGTRATLEQAHEQLTGAAAARDEAAAAVAAADQTAAEVFAERPPSPTGTP